MRRRLIAPSRIVTTKVIGTPGADYWEARAAVLPILRTARESIGRVQTANIVAVGCVNELIHIAGSRMIRQAVRMHVPQGTEEINLRALKEGEKLAARWKRGNEATTAGKKEASDAHEDP